MKKLSLLIAFFSLSISTLLAQLQGHVDYEQFGISFDIPLGWQGQETQDMIVLGSNTVAGLVIITTHSSNREQLIQEAMAGMIDQNGTNMQLEGEVEILGDHSVSGIFSGTMEYQAAKAYVIGMANPYGQGIGVTVMSASTKDAFGQAHIDVANQLHQSFKFKKIDKSSEIEEWRQWLSDVRLTYMNSYYSSSYTEGGVSGGYSSEERIELCKAGYFTQSGNNQMTITGDGVSGLGYGNEAGQGTWKIIAFGNQLRLILTYHDGEESSYNLEYTDEKLYLNGYRYFRTTEGDYAPNCP